MNLTYLWCHRAASCKSLQSSAQLVLCEGREGSTCRAPQWQKRQLRWPVRRTHSCGCGDTRGKTKRRFRGKTERARAPGEEPLLTSLCQGAEITRATKKWRRRGRKYFFIYDVLLIKTCLTLQRCFKGTTFLGPFQETIST